MTTKSERLDAWMDEHLVCPRDQKALERSPDQLRCPDGHRYPVVDGFPVMLIDNVSPTLENAWEATRRSQTSPDRDDVAAEDGQIETFVQNIIAGTCGYMYKGAVDQLDRYPIPTTRLEDGEGRIMLDVGCNWGRWCIAAAGKGYLPVGFDPNLNAVRAAAKVADHLGVAARFLVADARHLPFKAAAFDTAFSYSVLQHFSKQECRDSLAEIARVLGPDGNCLIQMPNWLGIRCLFHQAKRQFREGKGFEVRYWGLRELRRTFEELIGPSRLTVDGFFGLGIQPTDIDVLPWKYRMVVRSSEVLRGITRILPFLIHFADSVYVHCDARGRAAHPAS